MPRAHPFALLIGAVLIAAACRPSTPAAPGSEQSGRSFPAVAGDSLPVTMGEHVRPPRDGDKLPALAIAGGAGTIEVTWELRDGPCMMATATARRAGADVELRVARGGNPVALCAAGEVVYRYHAVLGSVPAGRYRVRVVEVPVEQAPRAVGAGDAVVRSGT